MKNNKIAYPATLLADFYKVSHREQYPKGTEKIYATFTPRASRIEGVNEVMCFGLQAFIKEYLTKYFDDNFFFRPIEDVVAEYARVIKFTLGEAEPDTSHIAGLHKLGYLPIKIASVKEGTLVPIRVPMFTIENTVPEFFWVTNYLETLMSCAVWQPMTSATIALQYRKLLQKYALETNGDTSGVQFQGHDFSMRGMSSPESAKSSGAGHLLSFVGTDTIPAILFMEEFYNADIEKELVGTSIPATEHSVQCTYGKEDEIDTYRRLINEIYPTGFFSVVSDTWDLWKVITEYLPQLKEDIMKRDGRVVIRPDSGNPVDIICGTANIVDLNWCESFEDSKATMESILSDKIEEETPHGEHGESSKGGYFKFGGKTYKMVVEFEWNRHDKQYYFLDGVRIRSCQEASLSPSEKGVVELLWEIFGGTITEKGFKQLDTHIGCIYGDAITIARCTEICERLKAKGFASTNMVYGIGSYTYQYNTRDTFGFALKTTYAVVDGEERELFKDPITDDGTKKSQRGMVCVIKEGDGTIRFYDGLNKTSLSNVRVPNLLETVFENGRLVREDSLQEIRDRVAKNF